jgi:hypothetical protein
MTRTRGLLSILAVVGCSDPGAGDDDVDLAACTVAEQGVAGTELAVTTVPLFAEPVACDHRVLASAADVASAFPNGDAPQEVMDVDFAVDRVVLGLSNPAIRFIVDDGTQLVIGEEPLCQGAAPSCHAHVAHGTTRTTAIVNPCPYRGPDPCLAP